MPMNYTVHGIATNINGQRQAGMLLPPVGGQFGLATGVASAEIVGPCELRIIPGEDERVAVASVSEVQNAAAAQAAVVANAATSPLQIKANVEARFHLPRGRHYLAWA
jgi:hypothetical protein